MFIRFFFLSFLLPLDIYFPLYGDKERCITRSLLKANTGWWERWGVDNRLNLLFRYTMSCNLPMPLPKGVGELINTLRALSPQRLFHIRHFSPHSFSPDSYGFINLVATDRVLTLIYSSVFDFLPSIYLSK